MSEDTVALHKFNGKQYALAKDVQPYFIELEIARKRIETLEEALRCIAKVPRSEAAYGIIQVFVKYALEGEDG